MAGLGLVNALNEYQSGLAWQQGQQELARQKEQRAQLDAANKAATDVIGASQAEWAANGAQGQYKPNSSTLFKAAEARSAALARSGMWDAFLENEARVAPMRIQARGEALQRYESDGDIEALVRATYPTIFDGRDVVGVERIEGAPGSTNLGLAAIPTKIKLKYSDGKTESVEPQRIVQTVKQSLIDPQASAKNEIMLNFERAKAEARANEEIRVIKARGEETRETEGKKGEIRLGLADVNNTSRERVAAGNNQARLGAATVSRRRQGRCGWPAVHQDRQRRVCGRCVPQRRQPAPDRCRRQADPIGRVGQARGLAGQEPAERARQLRQVGDGTAQTGRDGHRIR